MEPKREYEIVTARRPIFTDEEVAEMARAINEADRRDGTLDFIDALVDEELAEESGSE